MFLKLDGNIYKKRSEFVKIIVLLQKFRLFNNRMKLIHKSYRFRIYPTKEQESLLSKHFGHCRFVFNRFLNERKEKYLNEKTSQYIVLFFLWIKKGLNPFDCFFICKRNFLKFIFLYAINFFINFFIYKVF